jgi:pimeloyl-ACP methyl ester carboxylesterase
VIKPYRLFARRYAIPSRPVEATTSDGVELRGHRLGSGPDAVVVCHGFTGSHRRPRQVVLHQGLAQRFTVFAFDFRGHGASAGRSTMGALEFLDVEAAVGHARAEGASRVVTVGASMGGIAVLRHGALVGGVDGVVAISTPARWSGHESDAVRKMVWLTNTRSGRGTLRVAGVRVVRSWEWAEAPVDLVHRIAPTPLLVVHGRDDHFFDEEEAWALYRRAGAPKRLMLSSRFGHAEDGYTVAFAEQLGAAIARMLDDGRAPGTGNAPSAAAARRPALTG